MGHDRLCAGGRRGLRPRDLRLVRAGPRGGDRFVGYLDDGDQPFKAFGRDLPQLGDTHAFTPAPNPAGDGRRRSEAGKQALAQRLTAPGGRFATLLHPRAWISASARLGQGVVVGPFADVSADARGGDYVTLNAYASIGHDAQVGDFSTLSGYVDLMGGVKVGRAAFLGSGRASCRACRSATAA
jgi:hypothetical protein